MSSKIPKNGIFKVIKRDNNGGKKTEQLPARKSPCYFLTAGTPFLVCEVTDS